MLPSLRKLILDKRGDGRQTGNQIGQGTLLKLEAHRERQKLVKGMPESIGRRTI